MLSFMREREPEDSSAKKLPASSRVPTDSAEESGEQAPPLRQGRGQGDIQTQQRAYQGAEEYLTVAAQNKNARKSTMLLAVLFGMGLLCLWFMIKKSPAPAAGAGTGAIISTEETQIEMAIARLTGVRSEMFNRMDEIVKKFYEFSDVQQVKVDELVKNPFKHELFLVGVEEISDTEEGDFDIDAEMMRQQTKSMQLLSLMQSEQGNCCMIDDKILYEGDLIKGFKVSQIGDGFVKLEWDPSPSEGLGDPKRNEPRLSEGRDEGRLGTQIILKLSE